MRARRYIAPVLRLTVFLATCAAVLLYIDYRVARASVMERLLGIGWRMAPFMDDAHTTEGPREFKLNGVKLYLAVGNTKRSPMEVREWYAERYAGRGTAGDVFAEELKRAKLLPPDATGLSQATFGDSSRGGMAALDMGRGGFDLKHFADKAKALLSGKVGSVGALRYLYYERQPDGGTRFINVWTDSEFDLFQFLPKEEGDAPGEDLPDVPRYPGTVRVLSANERGNPGHMVAYVGHTGSPELAAAFYRSRLDALGWDLDPDFSRVSERRGLQSLRFTHRKKSHELMLNFSDEENGQGLTVVAIQLR